MGSLIDLKHRYKGLSLLLGALVAALPAGRALAQGARPAARPGGAAEPSGPKVHVEKKKVKIELPKQDRVYREETSPDKQEQARKIFHLANERFEQRRVDEAVILYRKALRLWPHPRILFNIAVSLGFLSQPLESAKVFGQVLRYGPDPITPERYKQASDRYLELLGQLAVLQVVCGETGANVYVNGRPVGTGPLDKKVTLGPGTHMVTANLSGKVPYSAQVRLEPGSRAKLEVRLRAFTEVLQYKLVDRYHWAVPSIVTTVAAALLGAGVGLLVQGRADVGEIQDGISEHIRLNGPSTPFTYDTNKEDKGVTMQITGQALLGAAGAAAVAAVVLWLVRKKRVSYTADAKPDAKGGKVEVRF